jgi:hypothetical protein
MGRAFKLFRVPNRKQSIQMHDILDGSEDTGTVTVLLLSK